MLRPLYSVVLAMSEDKDLAGCMPSLLRLLDHDISHIHCTEVLFLIFKLSVTVLHDDELVHTYSTENIY